MNTTAQSFRLAPMSPQIRILTLVHLVGLPEGFLFVSVVGTCPLLALPALFIVVLYVWVWVRFRPTRFDVYPDRLEVHWPLKRRSIPRKDIADVRLIDIRALYHEIGRAMRVGVGGLWGGFGWLWTQRRGIVQMYISRTDGYVWIERLGDRPWLITPEDPEAFVQALYGAGKG